MKKMHKKNRLYMIPGLLFCIGLQGTDAKTIPSKSTQTTALETNTDVSSDTDTDNDVNQQALDAYDVAITRVHNRPNKPKPNNTASQNTAGSYSMQNMPASQQNIIRPQNNMLGSQYTQPQNMPESQQSITWSPNNMSESQQYNNQYYQNQAQLSDSQAQNYNNQEQYDNTQMQYYSDSAQYGTSQGQDNNGNQPQYAGNQEQYNNSQWYYSNNQEQPTGYTSNQGQNYNSKIDYTNDNTQQNSAGLLDTNFRSTTTGAGSTIGYVVNTMGFTSAPRAVITQPDNKVVVAGIRDDYPFLARLNDNGSLDQDFGTGNFGPGKTQGVTIQTSLGKGSWFNAVAIQEFDQKIVAVGGVSGKCFLARYNAGDTSTRGGTVDTSFGVNGIVRTNIDGEFRAVAVQKDHKIVVAGYSKINTGDTQIVVVRYNKNGSLDTSFGTPFGTPGVATTYVGRLVQAHAITIQEDHKIIVVGSTNAGHQHNIVITRYTKDGVLDKDFGPNKSGVVTLDDIGKNSSIAYDTIVQKDGKIIVVGSSISEHNKNLFTTIRLEKNGLLDTHFGTNGNGIVVTNTANSNDNAYATSVVLDKKDNIIVMGYVIGNSNAYNYFTLVRYDKNGNLDTSFGQQGIRRESLWYNDGRNAHYNHAEIPVVGAIQNNGEKLVLAGMYSYKTSKTASLMAVARFHN